MNDSKALQEIIGLLYEIRNQTKEHMLPPGTAAMLQIGAQQAQVLYLTAAYHFGECRIEVQNSGIRIALTMDDGQILWQTLVHFHPDDIVAMNSKASRI